MTNEILWIAAILVFVIIEASTAAVISIWFAGGALAALIASVLGAGIGFQMFLFLLVSVILVAFLRKIAFKSLKQNDEKTNLDRIIGSEIRISREVNNKMNRGSAFVGDVEWKVKSQNGEIIPENKEAVVVGIEGVRLVVKNKEE